MINGIDETSGANKNASNMAMLLLMAMMMGGNDQASGGNSAKGASGASPGGAQGGGSPEMQLAGALMKFADQLMKSLAQQLQQMLGGGGNQAQPPGGESGGANTGGAEQGPSAAGNNNPMNPNNGQSPQGDNAQGPQNPSSSPNDPMQGGNGQASCGDGPGSNPTGQQGPGGNGGAQSPGQNPNSGVGGQGDQTQGSSQTPGGDRASDPSGGGGQGSRTPGGDRSTDPSGGDGQGSRTPGGDRSTDPSSGGGQGTSRTAGGDRSTDSSGDVTNQASGGRSTYGKGVASQIMTEEERNARYYEGGKPNEQSYYGNSTNVKSDVVAKDIVNSVKNNWGSVDPKVRDLFESGQADSFFGKNKPAGFDKMEGWQKAALFELGKSSFETSGTLDPNHKDPGDQAWGNFSLYNKDAQWKNYGLSCDPRSEDGKAALTSPGYGVIADLNTLPQSHALKQDGNQFDSSQDSKDWLDRAHLTFVDVNKGMGEYNRQKSMVLSSMFEGGNNTKGQLGVDNLFDLVMQNS